MDLTLTSVSTRAALGRLDRFRRDEGASLSVEAVLVLPLLLWAFLATYTFFDIYRAKNLSLKANYAISDLLSRETTPLDMTYLQGAEAVFRYLTNSNTDSWLRVTVVYCEDDCADPNRDLRRDWSRATDSMPTFTDDDVMTHLEPIIPWIASGERVIIVETGIEYEPPFSQNLTGVGARNFIDIVMTRPRFAAQLCWDGVNCGT